MEVIEGGPGPEPPLLAAGLPEPPTLEGGSFVRGRESHRGAVILVLSLLLFCELEEHRVGTGPNSTASTPGGAVAGSGLGPPSGFLPNPRAWPISEPIHPRLALSKQTPSPHHPDAALPTAQVQPPGPETPTSQVLGDEANRVRFRGGDCSLEEGRDSDSPAVASEEQLAKSSSFGGG